MLVGHHSWAEVEKNVEMSLVESSDVLIGQLLIPVSSLRS